MKKCLITVDYQVDFVNGSLGFDGAEKLENAIAEKIEKYRAEGADVIFTLDTHHCDYLTTFEGRIFRSNIALSTQKVTNFTEKSSLWFSQTTKCSRNAPMAVRLCLII